MTWSLKGFEQDRERGTLRPACNDCSVAVIFELVVNFGRDEDAVAAATHELEQHPTVEVRGVQLPVTPPFVTRIHSDEELAYIEFSVYPRGIGYGSPIPHPPIDVRDLRNDEIGAVGEELYELLRRFHGYETAMVGWDPEYCVDVRELESDWLPDGTIYKLHGLVLSDALIERWRPEGFVPFAPGFSWLPYRGTPNLGHERR